MFDILLLAFALFLVLEGIGPMLFPNKWRAFVLTLADRPVNELRMIGGVMVTIGLVSLLYWL